MPYTKHRYRELESLLNRRFMNLKCFAFLMLTLISIPGLSNESRAQRISGTIEIQAPAHQVWSLVGDFSHPERWLPVILSTRSPGNSVGSIREVHLKSDAILREKLVFRSNRKRLITYIIVDPTDPSIMPLRQYQAKITVKQTPSGSSVHWETRFLRWSQELNPPEHLNDQAAHRMVQKILDYGLANLKDAAER